jgi:hypothetical protein
VNIAGCLDPADRTEKLYAVDVVPIKKKRSLVMLAGVQADNACANYSWSKYRVSR